MKALALSATNPANEHKRIDPENDKMYKYRRPTSFRKGVRDKVWGLAENSEGIVRDPLTKKPMKKNEPWDMGHKPGYEFRKHQRSALERGISREQFLDEHNNPIHYRTELPSSNRGYLLEDDTNDYFEL